MPTLASILLPVACSLSPNIIDHMVGLDDYLSNLEHAENPQARRAAYYAQFVDQHPVLYREFVNPDELTDTYFERVINFHMTSGDELRKYANHLRNVIGEATSVAARTYGADLSGVMQVMSLNLGRSNAQVRLYGERVAIMYGIDTSVYSEPLVLPNMSRDARPTIAHELFHAHHWQTNSFMMEWVPRFLPPHADAPLWINLWSEGLASCAARHAYPEAEIDLILLLEGAWDQTAQRQMELSRMLLNDLDKTDERVTERWAFLQLPERADGLPNKAGYTLAMIAAHHIVRRIGLDAATVRAGQQLRDEFELALAALAEGDGAVDASDVCRPALREVDVLGVLAEDWISPAS